MKKRIYFIIAILLMIIGGIQAQETSQEHFLVEFDKFTPPIQDMITNFEGQPAENFLASDVQGKEHFLGDYKGKKVILWFWSIKDTKAQKQVGPMELLAERNNNLRIISFVSEPKSEVAEYASKSNIKFPIIPNGDIFGEMAYGADLGKPRMFIIDSFGVIKSVLPEEAFQDNTRLLIALESILNGFN